MVFLILSEIILILEQCAISCLLSTHRLCIGTSYFWSTYFQVVEAKILFQMRSYF